MNEELAIYYFQNGHRKIHIYGCWDKETKEAFDFFDLVEDNGQTINEGSPFYAWPTWEEVLDFIN